MLYVRFNYMAISDDIQRYMPSAADRDEPRGTPLAYKEAVLLVNPQEPQFKGEVDDKYEYSMDNKDNAVHGWITGGGGHPSPMGFWVITPSNEFKSGGPMKRELTSHVGPTSLTVRSKIDPDDQLDPILPLKLKALNLYLCCARCFLARITSGTTSCSASATASTGRR
jgi:hypothetical protein